MFPLIIFVNIFLLPSIISDERLFYENIFSVTLSKSYRLMANDSCKRRLIAFSFIFQNLLRVCLHFVPSRKIRPFFFQNQLQSDKETNKRTDEDRQSGDFRSMSQIYRVERRFSRGPVYTDVYVSRYWTKVAPSVLDVTRSDLSPGADFSVQEGETTRRAIFLRLQLDNVLLSPFLSRPATLFHRFSTLVLLFHALFFLPTGEIYKLHTFAEAANGVIYSLVAI